MMGIKNGKEVTIDYSTTDDNPIWKINCRCSSKNCRKTIGSIQFLPLRLFKKYKPFIPKFLQDQYKLISK